MATTFTQLGSEVKTKGQAPRLATPDMQRQAIVVREDDGSFRFETQTAPLPSIQPWEVLVKMSVTGLCGTDITLALGHAGPTCDVLGHEGVGRIAALGSGLDAAAAGLALGDRVGVAWVRDVCGRCACCAVPGGEVRCLEQLNSGRKIDGTLQEYCVVPGRYVLRLPAHDGGEGLKEEEAQEKTIPDEQVAPILCAGVTAYNAIKSCEAVPGDWIAIAGAGGGVGALAIQYARAMGYRVIAIDVGDAKRDFCLAQGAEAYCDALGGGRSHGSVVDQVGRLTRGALAKSVIVTAGSGPAYRQALELVAVFGTVVAVGIPPPDQTLTLHPLTLIDKGCRLISVSTGSRQDTLEALAFVARGKVAPIVHMSTLEDLNTIAHKVANTAGKYVIKF